MRRLEKAAHSLNKTKQSFVQEIVLERVAEVEERRKIQKQAPISGGSSTRVDTDGATGGLGIAAALKQPRPKEQLVDQPAPVTPVVVHVGNTNTPTSATAHLSDLDRLALYVIKGDDFLRDMRKRTMLEVLRASANTDEEYNVLVAQLEQVIAVKTKVAEENTPVNKLARFAFDKLSSLLKGD